jgi:hypothetical protein
MHHYRRSSSRVVLKLEGGELRVERGTGFVRISRHYKQGSLTTRFVSVEVPQSSLADLIVALAEMEEV